MASHDQFHRRLRLQPRVPIAEPEPNAASVVYYTAPPTFTGAIAGYTTIGVVGPTTTPVATPTPTPVAVPSVASSKPAPKAISPSVAPVAPVAPVASVASVASVALVASTASNNVDSSIPAASADSSTLPTVISAPSSTIGSSGPLLAATGSISSIVPTLASMTGASESSSSPTASSVSASTSGGSSSSSNSGGTSGGAKAGIAIGLLLLFGTIFALVLFALKRRKEKEAERVAAVDHEKQNPFADNQDRHDSSATIRSTPNAPRLSLRPVTEFIPNLMEKRQSSGNLLTANAAPITEKTLPMQRSLTAQSNNVANPFGNHAESIDSTNANGPAEVPEMTSPVLGSVVTATVTGAAVTGAAVEGAKLTRGASKRENTTKPLDFTNSGPIMGPPSPSGTEFSVTYESSPNPAQTGTAVAIAAAGGPPNSAVHRVQLDFKPSMDDELELRAGQLIRVLHEYDDGWALCIRLDRSKQGVCPRTCLSTRPVKPRPQQGGPQGRPMAANGRPMTPTGPNQARPMTPNGQGRPMTPQGQQSRPMTPQGPQGRPMTPNGHQGRPRAPSNAQQQARRNSPPGPTRMNPTDDTGFPVPSGGLPARKPVPGQAL